MTQSVSDSIPNAEIHRRMREIAEDTGEHVEGVVEWLAYSQNDPWTAWLKITT